MEQRRALGRGIASLIPRTTSKPDAAKTKEAAVKAVTGATAGVAAATEDSPYREVPLQRIRSHAGQPRKNFDEAQLAELAQSIREKGLLHPLVVRKRETGYEIISGERRFRACQQLGLETVPVLVREVEDREQLELALIENLQRADLDPIEEAQAYQELIEKFQATQEEIAKQLGRSRSVIANALRLLRLPEKFKEALKAGKVSMGHAKVLLAEPVERQLYFLAEIIKRRLSVRELEKIVQRNSQSTRLKAVSSDKKGLPPALERVVDELRTRLGTQVNLLPGKDETGKIVIDYYSQEQLDELYQRLTGFQITKRKTVRG